MSQAKRTNNISKKRFLLLKKEGHHEGRDIVKPSLGRRSPTLYAEHKVGD